jgi:hypothetical protein
MIKTWRLNVESYELLNPGASKTTLKQPTTANEDSALRSEEFLQLVRW